MWIQKIKLTHFKSYEQAEFIFPKPVPGKNIVLVGAENGHGKTTLLESIYLGLYGKNATRQLERVGLSDRSYDSIMNKALFVNAKAVDYSTLINMSIELTLINSNENEIIKGIRIKRNWKYDRKTKKRNISDDECAIYKLSDEGEEILSINEHDRYINDYGLPYSYAPFFFFDGEKVGEQAKQVGAGTWLKKGLDGLCGVTLLGVLESDLAKYVTDCMKDSNPEDRQKLDKLQKEFDNLVNKNKETINKCAASEAKTAELTQKQDELQNLLGGVGENAQTTEQIRSKINDAKQAIDQAEAQISDALKTIPLGLISSTETSVLQQTLTREANRLHYDEGKKQGESKIEHFLEAFANSPDAQEYVSQKVLRSDGMRKAIQDAWNTLWYPLPENCAESVVHDYLTLSSHADIKKTISELSTTDNDLEKLCDSIAHHEEKINNLTIQLSNLSGTKSDSIIAELKSTSSELKVSISQFTSLKNLLTQNDMRILDKETVIEEYQQKIISSEPNQIKAKRASDLKAIIADLKIRIIENKLNAVSIVASRINSALSHDERIDRIEIESNGSFILNKGSAPVEPSTLSAGQTQILILSMVAALAEVTNYQVPYVIDTPLARLDITHREHLMRHWAKLPQQIILLSQDAEISQEIAHSHAHSVQKTYLIKAETLADGGAKSVLNENTYF